jgi:hypothetical protein
MSPYPLILSLEKTWNEKRMGNVGKRQDTGRRVLEVAEFRYIHLGSWSEHVEHWSNKRWHARRGRKCQREKRVHGVGFRLVRVFLPFLV